METFWLNVLGSGALFGLVAWGIRFTFMRILKQIDKLDDKIDGVDTRLTVLETEHKLMHKGV